MQPEINNVITEKYTTTVKIKSYVYNETAAVCSLDKNIDWKTTGSYSHPQLTYVNHAPYMVCPYTYPQTKQTR